MNHLKQAWRSLRNAPLFTLTVLATLAVGIGANTAIFSVVYGMLLRPFPYRDPDRLVKINTYPVKSPKNEFSVSLKDMEDFQQQARQFESFGGYQTSRVNLVSDGPAVPLMLTSVTSDLLTTVGVAPLLGRNFLPDEDRPGGDINKVILSHSLWISHYSGDRSIIGRTIRTAMNMYTVVGVMPPGFAFPSRTDLWVPVESGLALRKDTRRRDWRGAQIIGRLQHGVSIEAAQSEIEAIGRELQRLYPKTHSEMLHRVQSLRDAETRQLRPYLVLLMVAVGLVLLICCANVANLILARSAIREREMTIRAALGASRRTLVARLLTESLILALGGGALGLLLARILVESIPRLIPQQLPVWMQIELDPVVLAFTAGVSVLTGILFGLAPAVRSSRVNLNDVLREGARGSRRGGWQRKALVAAEVSLSLVLLVSAALLLKSFRKLLEVDPGFASERVVTVSMSPYRPGTNAERIEQVCRYYREVIRRLEELPGVVAVGGTDNFPFTGVRTERSTLNIEGKGDTAEESRIRAPANFVDVTPRYFEAMNIPLLEGRLFNENDTQKAPWVIILSERAAKAIFPGRSALGKQVRAGTPGHWDPYATVVGVVGNVKYRAQDDNQTLEFYYPYTQYGLSTAHLAVRVRPESQGIEQLIRQTAAAVDPETAVNEVKALRGLIDDSLWQQRLWGALLAGFAGVALLLAIIGIYGVMACAVSQRTREIGIRMAIGANPRNVLSMVIGEGLLLVGIGLAAGGAFGLITGRGIRTLLFEVSPEDPSTYLTVSALLAGVAAIACFLPAWRAARIDPVRALREE